jgi:hypothetical protein
MIKISNPVVIDKLFNDLEYSHIKKYLLDKPKLKENYDLGFGRYVFTDPLIDFYANKLILTARKIFNSETLLPSYSLFAHYEGNNASLYKHKDDNACTYTIDMCVYQNKTWDLWVEDKPYTLLENQALAYYGNDQLHWRNSFPSPDTQHVAMIFFHFVEPEHWWYTEGPDYINVIRNENNKI